MSVHVLTGTKQQIAQDLTQLPGEVHEAIVFVEEAAPIAPAPSAHSSEDIFAEMQPFVAQGNTEVDDSREAIYTRLDGE